MDDTTLFRVVLHFLVVFTEQLFAALVSSGGNRRLAVGCAAQSRFRCVDRAFRVPPFGNWWMGWRFTTSFGAEKKQETFSDFLLGGAAGGRLVFSFESSGAGWPDDRNKIICMKIIQLLLVILQHEIP